VIRWITRALAILVFAVAALVWLWIFNPLYGPLNLTLERLGLPSPSWFSDPGAARWAVIVMTAFTLGEAFVVVLAVRASLPRELYELAAVEGAGAWWGVTRVTLPLMAPTLLLLMFRDTIFSFQANFVPALIVTDTILAAVVLPGWFWRLHARAVRWLSPPMPIRARIPISTSGEPASAEPSAVAKSTLTAWARSMKSRTAS
jgi:ABC-type sugar transport system permease subunit